MQSIPQNILLLLIIILAPAIPAYFLFKMLPSQAFVKGPFKGYKIDLSGGFAGYFLVFLVLVGVRASFQSTAYEEWTAMGRIVQPSGTPTIGYLDSRYVTLSSPALKSDANGNFSFTFLVTPQGPYNFPYIYFNYPCCKPLTYFLGPKEKADRQVDGLPKKIDSKNKTVDIGDVNLVNLPAQLNGQTGPQSNPYLGQASK